MKKCFIRDIIGSMIEYELKKAGSLGEGVENLYEIICLLRSPDGCPWDRSQNNKTVTEALIDEAYEYMDGAVRSSVASMREEIGDVMINVFMNLHINEEHGDFTPVDALNEVCEKLIRRHPHVFGNKVTNDETEALAIWNSVKEKVEGHTTDSKNFFEHIPSVLPPLETSYEIQKKLRKVGFDWKDAEGVLAKVREELSEVEEALKEQDKDHVEEEIGDLLFSVVNLARFLKVRPNTALFRCNEKVKRRFQSLFDLAAERGIPLDSEHFEQMDGLWEEIKNTEKRDRE